MKLYIAGPMTGLPEFNYPAFFAAADALRDAGHDPINPARADGRESCKTWQDFMRASLRDIADAEGVAYLPGWSDSTGATIEVNLARELQMPVGPLGVWLLPGRAT